MKAITLHQPWASLIAIGAKTIETRPSPPNGPMCPDGVRGYPGLRVERGERIAIHAAKVAPTVEPTGWDLGRHTGRPVDWPRGEGVHLETGDWFTYRIPETPGPVDVIHLLPLGAVVATAVVARALPIIGSDDRVAKAWLPHLAPYADRGMALWGGENDYAPTPQWKVELITDEALGDFSPGRWGWFLADVEPLATPLPVRGRQGVWSLSFEDDFDLEVSRG